MDEGEMRREAAQAAADELELRAATYRRLAKELLDPDEGEALRTWAREHEEQARRLRRHG